MERSGGMASQLMTVPEVLAELKDVPRRTFYRWRERGVGPVCIKLPNGELRVDRTDLDAWLQPRREVRL